MKHLSKDLLPIYEMEMKNGNCVERVDEPAGTDCPFAVIMSAPLDTSKIASRLKLPKTVEYWENKDPHYPLEGGYYSRESKHVIAGPLKQ